MIWFPCSTRIVLLMSVASLVIFCAVLPTFAQGPPGRQVDIKRVDATNFPVVRVYASVSDSSGQRVVGLEPADFEVRENGVPVDLELGQESVGLQVILVIDASGSMNSPGASGKTRLDEAKEAVHEFTESHMQDAAQDWAMLLAPEGSEGEVTVISDWTYFRREVQNQMYLYLVPAGQTQTPLFNTIWEGIEKLNADEERKNLYQTIVVFSDGIDTTSYITQENVTSRAQQAGLAIHTIFLSPTETEYANNLKNLADVTGGQYIHYTSLESTLPLFAAIASQREQTILQYRSTNPESGDRTLQVDVRASDPSSPMSEDQTSFTVDVRPPQVSISLPSGTEIRREGTSPGQDPTTIEPRTWPVAVDISWPDGHRRDILEAACLIDNASQQPKTSSPYDRLDCEVALLASGPHSLKVRVRDELGLQSESAEIPLDLQVIIPTPPPTPTFTPSPTPTTTPAPTSTPGPSGIGQILQRYSSLGAVLIALAALALVVVVLMRRPAVASAITSTAGNVMNKVKEITEPFFLGGAGPAGQHEAKAYLLVIDGDTTHPGPIELVGENTRLGRDLALVNVEFEDRSVSRLHARITEREDDLFFIYDEGSSSGTFVNREPVPINGQLLQHNDRIHLGRVQLQFKLRGVDPEPELGLEPEPYSVTEPFGLAQIWPEDRPTTERFDSKEQEATSQDYTYDWELDKEFIENILMEQKDTELSAPLDPDISGDQPDTARGTFQEDQGSLR